MVSLYDLGCLWVVYPQGSEPRACLLGRLQFACRRRIMQPDEGVAFHRMLPLVKVYSLVCWRWLTIPAILSSLRPSPTWLLQRGPAVPSVQPVCLQHAGASDPRVSRRVQRGQARGHHRHIWCVGQQQQDCSVLVMASCLAGALDQWLCVLGLKLLAGGSCGRVRLPLTCLLFGMRNQSPLM